LDQSGCFRGRSRMMLYFRHRGNAQGKQKGILETVIEHAEAEAPVRGRTRSESGDKRNCPLERGERSVAATHLDRGGVGGMGGSHVHGEKQGKRGTSYFETVFSRAGNSQKSMKRAVEVANFSARNPRSSRQTGMGGLALTEGSARQ